MLTCAVMRPLCSRAMGLFTLTRLGRAPITRAMDRLEEEIRRKRQAVEAAQRELEQAKERARQAQQQLDRESIELAAFQKAAQLRPAGAPPEQQAMRQEAEPTHQRRLGRQPGAIKKEWREVLRDMLRNGNRPQSPSAISLLAERFGLPHDAKSIRERFRGFESHGFVEKVGDDYRVTDVAVQRFDLDGTSPLVDGEEDREVSAK